MESHKNKIICPVELTCIETAVRGTKHNNIKAECKETATLHRQSYQQCSINRKRVHVRSLHIRIG